MSFLQLLDVRPLADVSAGVEPVTRTKLQTWDGLIITIAMFEFDDLIWAHISAVFDQQLLTPLEKSVEAEDSSEDLDKVQSIQREAQEIESRHNQWVYLIEDEKIEKLSRRSEDLMKADIPEEDSDASPADQPGAVSYTHLTLPTKRIV